MGRPKRNLLATAEETTTPPASLDDSQAIARVKKAEGKNLYSIELSSGGKTLLVELPSRFRSQIWIKRGGYVVVDTSAFDDRDNKLDGEIVNVVREEKQWRKQAYWSVHRPRMSAEAADSCIRPTSFAKTSSYPEESEEEDSTVGKLPPLEDSDTGE